MDGFLHDFGATFRRPRSADPWGGFGSVGSTMDGVGERLEDGGDSNHHIASGCREKLVPAALRGRWAARCEPSLVGASCRGRTSWAPCSRFLRGSLVMLCVGFLLAGALPRRLCLMAVFDHLLAVHLHPSMVDPIDLDLRSEGSRARGQRLRVDARCAGVGLGGGVGMA